MQSRRPTRPFRPRSAKNHKWNILFVNFDAGVSKPALCAMRQRLRELKIRRRTDRELKDIATELNPILRGWLDYYGRYHPSALRPLLRHVDEMLAQWAMRKYKRLKGHKVRARRWIEKLARDAPHLFVHWQKKSATRMPGGSGMRRESHVPF